jgi:hypothetical protein
VKVCRRDDLDKGLLHTSSGFVSDTCSVHSFIMHRESVELVLDKGSCRPAQGVK